MVIVRSRTAVRDATPGDYGAIRDVASAANEEFRLPMGDTLFEGYLVNVMEVERRARDAAGPCRGRWRTGRRHDHRLPGHQRGTTYARTYRGRSDAGRSRRE